MQPLFLKFHGLGNDYIVIEAEQLRGVNNLSAWARQICDRHYGAGADGVALVSHSENHTADFRVRIFNPDGSEAALSGNGTRCAAAFLFYRELWADPELRLDTRSGVMHYTLREQTGKHRYVFDSALGRPEFDSSSVSIKTDQPLDRVIDYPITVEGEQFRITALKMGNPNCCIFVDNFDLEWRRIGKALENHQHFPIRTNVVFVLVRDRQNLELRIWERGVGETSASGTCSCAAAVAAMVNEKAERSVNVVMPGGQVKITWRDDSQVVITGAAEVVYSGKFLVKIGE